MNNLSFYLEKLDIVENVWSPSHPETKREGGRVEGGKHDASKSGLKSSKCGADIMHCLASI